MVLPQRAGNGDVKAGAFLEPACIAELAGNIQTTTLQTVPAGQAGVAIAVACVT